MLSGKSVLITGSTSGIGLGIAKILAKENCNLMVNGFGDPKQIKAIVHDLSLDTQGKVHYHPADLSKPAAIQEIIEATQKAFGSLDILVNNAGIQHVSPIQDFAPEKWDQIIALNLSASFHTIRHALPLMLKRDWGRIINIASSHGLVASPNKSAYVAAKHGLVGLTKVVALETAQSNITCNAICPGWVLTPLVQAQIEENAKQQKISIEQATIYLLAEKQPSQQFVQVEEIGELCRFLCTSAARQITGAALSIDGGWTAE